MRRIWKPLPSASSAFFELRPGRVLLVLVTAVVVWAAGSLGLLRDLESPVYDLFMRWRATQRASDAEAAPRVFLLELSDPSSRDTSQDDARNGTSAHPAHEVDLAEVDLALLVEKLRQLGARLIVFTEPVLDPGFFEKVPPSAPDLVFAVPVRPRDDDAGLFEVYGPSPVGALTGAVFAPPYDRGIHRRQQLSYPTTSGPQPSLATVVAQHVAGEKVVPEGTTFWVDFRGPAGSLPHLAADRALAGDLIPELVQDRVVLIGTRETRAHGGLHTPTTTEPPPFSRLEYHGHAVHTLLTGSAIEFLGLLTRLLCLAGLVSVSYLVYRTLSLSSVYWLTLAAVLGHAALGLLTFCYGELWISTPQFVLAQIAVFLLFLRSRVVDLTRAFRQLVSESTQRLHAKSWPVSLTESRPSWSLVAHLIDQTLDLNRMIFLETDPDRRQLVEVLSLHCSFDDIAERRRTYTRRPYSDAVAAKGPIRITGFFEQSGDDEEHYIIPLIFAGELLGFWAFGINTFKAAVIPRFQEILRQYTARISELLFEARRRERRSMVETVLGRKISAERTERTYTRLSSAFLQLEVQLDTLQQLVNQLDTGVIVYDIFGRLLHINDRMLEYLRDEDIAPFNMTALDLLLAVSDADVGQAKGILRKVVVDQSSTILSLEFPSHPSSRFAMQVKPLAGSPQSGANEEEHAATQAAVVFELIDTTEVTQHHEMKSALTERFLVQMRRDLATIDLSATLLSSLAMPPDHCHRMGTLIHGRVEDAVQSVSECQQYLCDEAQTEGMDRFPVDPLPTLKAAIEEAKKTAAENDVSIELWEPGTTRYTLASTVELRFMFRALLDVLVGDATEDSVVLVRFSGDENLVAIDFSNRGFGIPNEALQEYLYGDEVETADEIAKIRKAAAWVEDWGGIFEASSGVGIGMHFTIHLARFL